MPIIASGRSKPRFGIAKLFATAAFALGIGLFAAGPAALAQHSGGGSHGGGGGSHGGGGGFHGGSGGFHGGGFHGGGFHDGFHGGFGRGWGGYYGGFYPGFGFGFDAYDPFWYDYYDPAPLVFAPMPFGYAPPPEAYGPPPTEYYEQQQYSAPITPSGGLPTDNSRGFYTWQLGVESGSCNRPYLQQIAANLTGATPASLQRGAKLGGIAVMPVIGGRIGPRLDFTDQACATEALEHAQTGTVVQWQSASGIPITFQVIRTTDSNGGQACRDYETTAQIGKRTETVSGGACKYQDGSWRSR